MIVPHTVGVGLDRQVPFWATTTLPSGLLTINPSCDWWLAKHNHMNGDDALTAHHVYARHMQRVLAMSRSSTGGVSEHVDTY